MSHVLPLRRAEAIAKVKEFVTELSLRRLINNTILPLGEWCRCCCCRWWCLWRLSSSMLFMWNPIKSLSFNVWQLNCLPYNAYHCDDTIPIQRDSMSVGRAPRCHSVNHLAAAVMMNQLGRNCWVIIKYKLTCGWFPSLIGASHLHLRHFNSINNFGRPSLPAESPHQLICI